MNTSESEFTSQETVGLDINDTLLTQNATSSLDDNLPLSMYVRDAVYQYFVKLDGQLPVNLYDTILHEVEKPLLTVVLEHTNGNQSKAAQVLGLNRGTLRKKLQQYDLM